MSTLLAPQKLYALSGDSLHRVLGQALPVALAQAGQLLLIKDASSGRCMYASDAMAALLHAAPGSLAGASDSDIFEPALAATFRAAEHTALSQAEPLHSEHSFELHGERREFSVLRLVVQGAAPGEAWLVSVWTDVAPEQKRQAQMQAALAQIEQQQMANDALRREISDQALRDPLSGLYRRAHFEDQLRREVDLSTREHREFAIVFIELDAETPAVAAHGEAGRQRVFEAMGRLLRSGTRAMDASCRYDERRFAVLLSGVGLATAHARMEGLRRKCATQIVVHGGQELGFTVAVGVASFPHTTQSQDELLAACEAALREAQRRGGNHVTLAAIRFASN